MLVKGDHGIDLDNFGFDSVIKVKSGYMFKPQTHDVRVDDLISWADCQMREHENVLEKQVKENFRLKQVAAAYRDRLRQAGVSDVAIRAMGRI